MSLRELMLGATRESVCILHELKNCWFSESKIICPIKLIIGRLPCGSGLKISHAVIWCLMTLRLLLMRAYLRFLTISLAFKGSQIKSGLWILEVNYGNLRFPMGCL